MAHDDDYEKRLAQFGNAAAWRKSLEGDFGPPPTLSIDERPLREFLGDVGALISHIRQIDGALPQGMREEWRRLDEKLEAMRLTVRNATWERERKARE